MSAKKDILYKKDPLTPPYLVLCHIHVQTNSAEVDFEIYYLGKNVKNSINVNTII